LNHLSKIPGFGRMAMGVGLLVGLAHVAHAQTDITPRTAAQSLSCLSKPAEPPRYPAQNKYDRGSGLVRVLLKFNAPDQPPTLEILANTARENMQDQVERYVSAYRLPCWQPSDGTVQAVQEFSFSNSDVGPTALAPDRSHTQTASCIVMPRKDLKGLNSSPLDNEVSHVVVAVAFSGDGEQAPEVKVLHATADSRIQEAIVEFAQSYRMPCRTGKEAPNVFRQLFKFAPRAAPRISLKQDHFSLREFLQMTPEPQKLAAHFDFHTMSCPFEVKYRIYGPALPNEAEVAGPTDANKALFLDWLAKQSLTFKNERQANALFGSILHIQVPCGVLDLNPEPTAKAIE